jgi:perosamine synthetase
MPDRGRLIPALESVLYGGMIAEGEHVYEFERRFGQAFDLPYVVATSSGTAALHIALELVGVRPGNEVVTTAMTAEPTNTTILQVGATPVFADVDPATGNLDPDSVALAITPNTRAIIVVHYAGYPARVDAIRAVADAHGVAVIEDCAHALGARLSGLPVGAWGDYAIFSFQAIKHITTVDGGMLAMRDSSKIEQARRLRWFGLAKGIARTDVDITRVGYKYNMHNIAGAIGCAQMEDAPRLLNLHEGNGRAYDEAFCGMRLARPARVEQTAQPTYWLYTLLADNANAVISALEEIGVAASKLHRPNHRHSIFEPYRRPLPALDRFYEALVHLPCGWWVTEVDRQRIINAVRKVAE